MAYIVTALALGPGSSGRHLPPPRQCARCTAQKKIGARRELNGMLGLLVGQNGDGRVRVDVGEVGNRLLNSSHGRYSYGLCSHGLHSFSI